MVLFQHILFSVLFNQLRKYRVGKTNHGYIVLLRLLIIIMFIIFYG